MKQKIPWILVLVFPLVTCQYEKTKKTEKTNDYKMVAYGYNSQMLESVDTVTTKLVSGINEEFIFSWRFDRDSDTLWGEFHLIPGSASNSYYKDGQEVTSLEIIDIKTVILDAPNKQHFHIYKVLNRGKGIDSGDLTFFTKEFGLILQKPLYWRSIRRVEYLNDEKKNNIIRHLCFLIMRDTDFFNNSVSTDSAKIEIVKKHSP